MVLRNNYNAEYKVIGRVKDGTTVVAYVVIDVNGGKRMIKKEEFEKLALSKKIYNCTAQIYKGTVNLRGIGMKLTDLPCMSVPNKVKR